LFRRTDVLGFLQDSIFPPVAYRYLDAIELLKYIAHQSWPIEASVYSKTNYFWDPLDRSNSIDYDIYFDEQPENSDDDEVM
jgi:hypothetical protein